MRSAKRAVMEMTNETLLAIIRERFTLPDDVKLLGSESRWANNITMIYLESDTFAEIPEGGMLPTMQFTQEWDMEDNDG